MISPVHAVENSENKKLVGSKGKKGGMSATMVSQASCPKSCPWQGSGCYAESGPMGIHTSRVNKSDMSDPLLLAEAEASAIDNLTGKNHLRLHVVGDTTTNSGAMTLSMAAARYSAKHGRKVFTYTHGNTKREAWGDISVLRSVEDMAGAKKAHADNFAAAMVVETFKDTKVYPLEDGFKGFPCPAQTGRADGCVDCGACMNADKLRDQKLIVLFEAHGAKKKQMLPVLNDAAGPKALALV